MSTIQPKLHTNKSLSDGKFSVKLYIYDDLNEQTYWFPLGYSCYKGEWNEESGCFRKNYPGYKKKNLILKRFELKAHDIIDNFVLKGERFDFHNFKQQMGRDKWTSVSVLQFYDKIIQQHKEQAVTDPRKASSGKVWLNTKNLIKRFL